MMALGHDLTLLIIICLPELPAADVGAVCPKKVKTPVSNIVVPQNTPSKRTKAYRVGKRQGSPTSRHQNHGAARIAQSSPLTDPPPPTKQTSNKNSQKNIRYVLAILLFSYNFFLAHVHVQDTCAVDFKRTGGQRRLYLKNCAARHTQGLEFLNILCNDYRGEINTLLQE